MKSAKLSPLREEHKDKEKRVEKGILENWVLLGDT